jgi:hypothetical protein
LALAKALAVAPNARKRKIVMTSSIRNWLGGTLIAVTCAASALRRKEQGMGFIDAGDLAKLFSAATLARARCELVGQ